MVLKAKSWSEEIGAVTGLPEYQNATIELRNPALLVRVPNISTGEYLVTGDPVVWTGRARVVDIRSSVESEAGSLGNATSIQSVRIQIPYGSFNQRVQRGFQIRVIDGGRNRVLEKYLFVIESDFSGSQMATQTFEASADMEADPGWQTIVIEPLLPAEDLLPADDLLPS